MANEFSYGGQAVIEGVMMRGRGHVAIACRRADNEIVLQEEPVLSWLTRIPMLRWPMLRGMVVLIESLVLGIRALNFSASVFAGEEAEELGPKEMALTMIMAFAMTAGLFIGVPALVARLVEGHVGSNLVLNLIEGGVKVTMFVLYILAISLMPDIRRVFQYHGAEHKAINCYEAGLPLTVENVRRQSLIHTRCGTNFLLIVLLTSIAVFSFFGRPPFLLRILIHIAILPIVAGIAYEIIKRAAQPNAWWILKAIARPGMWLQRLTTRQPDDSQVEVAIRALDVVLAHDAAARPVRIAVGQAAHGRITG